MPDISVLSWNVCGLNSANKRTRCLDYLLRKHIDLVFVQEAHLTPQLYLNLQTDIITQPRPHWETLKVKAH